MCVARAYPLLTVTMATPPFVFSIGNDIYVSPNTPRPPSATELQRLDAHFSDPLLPTDAFHMRFADNRYPYLGFTMPHARYNSTVLAPLRYVKDTLPIVIKEGQYCLDPALAESWNELEVNLRTVAEKLFARWRPLMPADYDIFPFPGDYGYARGRRTNDGMRRAAMRARKAFAPLIALCSFAIAMTPKFTDAASAWLDFLGNNGAHPRWLQEFARTPIVDFSRQAKRIGCVVKPNCQFLEHIPKFVMANVPVWLVWNRVDCYAKTKCEIYKPSQEAVTTAKRWAQLGVPSEPAAAPAAIAIPAATVLEELSEPEKGSGQRKGEPFHDFMARRAARDALRATSETLQSRNTRMQRIAAAGKYPLPGSNGPRVYQWKQDGKDWIRKILSRGYVEQRWGDMAEGHLEFNSFGNEWDYCELFSPSAEPYSDEEYDDLANDYFTGVYSIEDASHETPRRRHAADSNAPQDNPFGMRNLEQAYVPASKRGFFTEPEPLDVILFSRYGFRAPTTSEVADTTDTLDENSWHFARKTLSDTESPWSWPELKIAVGGFVRHVIGGSLPPELWDMSPASPSPIGFSNDYMVVERVTNGSRVYYRIASQCEHADGAPVWDLFVEDAITAVECIRRSKTSREIAGSSLAHIRPIDMDSFAQSRDSPSNPPLGKAGLINFFLQTGRPFSTRMPVDHAPLPALAPKLATYSQGGLGERHVNYKPDVMDYRGYERDRAAFLMSDRARAAVQEGGIVWRLAIEHLNFDDIAGGPVDVEAGLYERSDGDAVGGWDDKLTDDELDLICGVYKIFTGGSDLDGFILLVTRGLMSLRSPGKVPTGGCLLVAQKLYVESQFDERGLLVPVLRAMVSATAGSHTSGNREREGRREMAGGAEAAQDSWPLRAERT